MAVTESDRIASLRARFAARRPVVLLNPDSDDPAAILRLVGQGFREIFLDIESGSVPPESLPTLCETLRAAGAIPLVRPATHHAEDISACLTAGALGIVAPGIASVAVAQAVCDTVARSSRADGLRLSIIESVAALPNVTSLAAVDTMDAYMIGPRDLGRSMDPPREPADAEVRAMVKDILGQLARTGKASGTPVVPTRIDELSQAGCSVFYVHAAGLDDAALAQFLALARS